ncbi:MAG: nucleoside monophosphate kinase [Pontiella sp.]
MNAVVLLGPPGSGKSTVSEVLGNKGYQHVSTGDMLRDQIRLKTQLGIKAGKLIDHGRFVSDEVAVGMIQELLEGSDASAKFLFDGFPRTLSQVDSLNTMAKLFELQLDKVILLECPDEVIIDRLSGRRSCDTCGTVYHIKYNPTARDGVCDIDGGNLVHRTDDTEYTIKKRLKVYSKRTAPLINYYKAKKLIHTIDATMSIDNVRDAALEQLN